MILDLSWNEIGDKGMKYISDALQYNTVCISRIELFFFMNIYVDTCRIKY